MARLPWHFRAKRAPPPERTDLDGNVFDSKSERARWDELCLLERTGVITNLRRQVALPLVIKGRPVKIRSAGFPNGRPAIYTVDFTYTENGLEVFEEYKAFDTPDARLRRAVVEAIYGIEIVVTGPAARDTPRIGAKGQRLLAAGG